MDNIRNIAKNGLGWTGLEKFGVQGTQFFILVAFARILEPNQIGIVAFMSSIVILGQTVITAGLGQALIQRDKIENAHYDTAYVVTLGIGLLMYFLGLIIFYIHSLISDSTFFLLLYSVLGMTLVINSHTTIQRSILLKELSFKVITKSTLPSVIIAGILSISLALIYESLWAIVFNIFLQQALLSIFITIKNPRIPKFAFSLQHFQDLWNFSWKLQLSALINVLNEHFSNLLVAYCYNFSSVAYFSRAKSIPRLLAGNLIAICESVTFPILAKITNEKDRQLNNYRISITFLGFMVFPICTSLVVFGYDFVNLLFGGKWLQMVPYMQLLAIGAAIAVFKSASLTYLKLNGATDVILNFRIIELAIMIIGSIIAVKYGLIFLALSYLLTGTISYLFLSILSEKYVGYGLFKQLNDLKRPIIVVALTLLISLSFEFLFFSAVKESLLLKGIIFFVAQAISLEFIGGKCWALLKQEISKYIYAKK